MLWFFMLLNLDSTFATTKTLPLCHQDNFTHLPTLCKYNGEYSASEYPEPKPSHVASRIWIKQILDVDEEHETFTLFVEFTLTWNDTRIGIVRSKKNKEYGRDWFPLLEERIKQVWTPSIVFTNAISVEKLETYGDDMTRRFFLFNSTKLHSQYFYYQVFLIIKITCDLNFHSFPFDSQKCELHYTNIIGHNDHIVLDNPIIAGRNGSQDSTSYRIPSGVLPFDAILKSVDIPDKEEMGDLFSRVGVLVELVREDSALHKLIGSYYAPSAIFTIISMFSFFIKPEAVPGRMGLIITLYLILINTFTSIKAPESRGFSYIELWFIGAQVPIVWALLEYGIILAILRRKESKSMTKSIYRADQFSFMASMFYFCIFNYYYWSKGLKEWYEHRKVVLEEH